MKLKLHDVTEAIANRRFDPTRGRDTWFADVKLKKTTASYRISDGSVDVNQDDAWDFDIENYLPLKIQISGKDTCKILSRLRNNKKYVKVSRNKD